MLHITVPMLTEYLGLIEDGVISSKIAKEVFERMAAGEGEPKAIVEKHGLVQNNDTGALEAMIDELIAANPGQAAQVKEKPQAIGWFVGQLMKQTGGNWAFISFAGGGERIARNRFKRRLIVPPVAVDLGFVAFSTKYQIGIEDAGNSPAFSSTARPSTRLLAPPRVARPPRTPATVGPDSDTSPSL